MISIGHRGETIIEVLMSVALLGLVISSSFVVARRSFAIGQRSTERTQATKIIQSQTERLKYMATQPGNEPGQGIFLPSRGQFCLEDNSGVVSITADITDPDCDHGDFPDSNLRTSIEYTQAGTNDLFTLSVLWEGLGQRSTDSDSEVTIVYRLHPIR